MKLYLLKYILHDCCSFDYTLGVFSTRALAEEAKVKASIPWIEEYTYFGENTLRRREHFRTSDDLEIVEIDLDQYLADAHCSDTRYLDV